jgi:hypothetical protein
MERFLSSGGIWRQKRKGGRMSKAIRQGDIYRDGRHRYHTPIGIIPSVTGITGILDKSNALIPWAVNVTCDYIINNWNERDGILKLVSRARMESTRVKREAADIGTAVHDLVEVWIKKRLGENVEYDQSALQDANVKSAFSAFLKWAEQVRLDPILSERMVWSKEWEYAGTLDLVGWMQPHPYSEPKLFLCDVKSSKGFYPQQMATQLVAYEKALMERPPAGLGAPIFGLGVIRLDKECGEPEWHDCTAMREGAWETFAAMRNLYHWSKQKRDLWKY